MGRTTQERHSPSVVEPTRIGCFGHPSPPVGFTPMQNPSFFHCRPSPKDFSQPWWPRCAIHPTSVTLSPVPTGTYLTHEAKGSDDAPDADTAIINAEGGQAGGDDKKEYFI